MADQRDGGISWTEETWNPVAGCSIVSPACTNCYAMSVAAMIERASGGRTHYAGTTKTVNGKPVWTGKLVMAPEHIVTAPLRWKRPRRVFVNSMSDLFHEDMPDKWIDRVFAIMALSPQHTFQVLTKRPERMRRYMTSAMGRIADLIIAMRRERGDISPVIPLPHITPGHAWWPLANVWLGVTAEDQARADERVPSLLETPAAIRFVSAEPLLGPIGFRQFRIPAEPHSQTHDALSGYSSDTPFGLIKAGLPDRFGRGRLDWIIVGGESGPGARPTHPDWVRAIRDDCAAAGVAFHLKQVTENGKKVPIDRWPADLRIQEFPRA